MRIRIPIVALGPDGRPLAAATMSVRNRVTGTTDTVYTNETGGATIAPAAQVSDAQGRFPGWTSRGRKEATVTPAAGSGLAPWIESWDAAPAGDADVDTAWLADGAVTVPKAALATYTIADLYANRPAAAAALNGVRFFATDKRMEWQCVAGAWVLLRADPVVSATPPATPIDGQRWAYVADAALGIVWRFEYRAASASASKWEVIGGGPALYSAINTDESATPDGSWKNMPTAGPILTVPFAGEYVFRARANMYASNAGPQLQIGLSKNQVTSAIPAPVVPYITQTLIPTAGKAMSLDLTGPPMALAATDNIRMVYLGDLVPGTFNARWRLLEVVPVRVG